jgi:Ca-activated chloride channel family protein
MDSIFAKWSERSKLAIWITIVVTVFTSAATGQDKCVSADRASVLLSEIRSGKDIAPNPELKAEILALKAAVIDETAQSLANKDRHSGNEKLTNSDKKPVLPIAMRPGRICQILNTYSWPGISLVEIDAASAWLTLIKTYLPVPQQRDLLPIVAAGIDRGEIPKDAQLASFIDRLRLRLGQPQMFGTQVTERDGFLVLYPLQLEENVDSWRKEYGMVPLRDQIRTLQAFYHKLLIRSIAKVTRIPLKRQSSTNAKSGPPLLNSQADEDVVKVDTSIVTIDATVSGRPVPKLEKSDFKIYEDGVEQDISSFDASDAPFDIVLLLDLSGSTADKLGLIKKTTKHFIEVKRAADRVSIVTFNSSQTVVSPLESDKEKLFDSVSKIKGIGSSKVWDSEKFALDLLKRDSPTGRRKAIVVMTDGIDNAIFFFGDAGSDILFGDLLEDVRNSQVSFFPIYLKPTGPDNRVAPVIENAQLTMQALADNSGGTFYTTANLDSLNEVYEHVIQDVGSVFSLGYQPKNDKRDGAWRTIKVAIPSHPELKVRARTGYYAK